MHRPVKNAILLVNLGTPKSPNIPDVVCYLKEFLLDSRVIDIGYIQRQLLVRGIIIPRRKKQVSKSYSAIWGLQGSPLLVHSTKLQERLQELVGDSSRVFLGMRYQQPSLKSVLEEIERYKPQTLTILPLFPQYASATTGSIIEKVMKLIGSWKIHPKVTFIQEFSTFSPYVNALADSITEFDPRRYDKVIFSFHGLPKRHVLESGPCTASKTACFSNNCCNKRVEKVHCYAASCHATARLVAEAAQLNNWSVAFQSRLGKEEWLQPYLTDEIHRAAKSGIKRILLISPSFIADCLETLYELGEETKADFLRYGGQELDVVPCLNERAAESLYELLQQEIKELQVASR